MRSELHEPMRAPFDVVFDLAADVERWPQILPHYRYVRPVADPNGERRFAMGARRGPIPVRWEAIMPPIAPEATITTATARRTCLNDFILTSASLLSALPLGFWRLCPAPSVAEIQTRNSTAAAPFFPFPFSLCPSPFSLFPCPFSLFPFPFLPSTFCLLPSAFCLLP